MQWSKFRSLREANPWIIETIDPLQYLTAYGRPNDRSNSVIREFVRSKLEYVAFRPWSSLDLRSPINIWREQNDPFVCDPYYGGNLEHSLAVEWMLVTRVTAGGREVLHVCPFKDGESISEQLVSIDKDYRRHWPTDVVVTYIAAVKSVSEYHRSSNQTTRDALRLEIFSFPPGYNPNPVQPPKEIPSTVGDRAAHRSFMNGIPMPPIIPGTLSFAG